MRILGDRILISPLPEKTISDGGIHLPGGETGDKKLFWKVDQLGTKASVPEIQAGSTVITPGYFSHTTLEDGSGRKIIGCDQIEGVFVEELPPVPEI